LITPLFSSVATFTATFIYLLVDGTIDVIIVPFLFAVVCCNRIRGRKKIVNGIMDKWKRVLNILRRPIGAALAIILVLSIVLAFFAYRLTISGQPQRQASPIAQKTPTLAPTPTITQSSKPSPTATPIILPPQDVVKVLGVDVGASYTTKYTGITWVRISHPSCGNGSLRGQELINVVRAYHQKNIRVLLTACQNGNMSDGDIETMMQEIARGYPDAVQCGNEEMKQDASVAWLYMAPERFAKFYDICERAVHKLNSHTPTLVGSLDPHVAGPDYQLMVGQANYLDQMQNAMNASVRPGGNWDWHNQALGVIDSWHNGYGGSNNLGGVFDFWAQQFHVDRNGGELGKHLWVVEGTGCFKGCGLDENNNAEIAISHILTLITDVETAMQAHTPFFFFSGMDFKTSDAYWPIGIVDTGSHPKPLRQDLAPGARTLALSCSGGKQQVVSNQLELLAGMYNHCTLPDDYVNILSN
jgi:hypothetical protein